MNDSRLTIVVAGTTGFIPVASFIEVVSNTLEMLKGLTKAISRKGPEAVLWRIEELSIQGPLRVTVFGEPVEGPDVGPEVTRAYVDGLNQLDRSPEAIPPHFTSATLESAKKLVNVLSDGVAKLTFLTPGARPARPTQRVAANVDAHRHEAMTSLEGRLEMISMHGPRAHFDIRDVLTEDKITCEFDQDLLEQAMSAFGRRVAVYGKARYSPNGRPESIQVQRIRLMRERHELPQAKDLEGIDLTGGVDPAEYVRRLRDAE